MKTLSLRSASLLLISLFAAWPSVTPAFAAGIFDRDLETITVTDFTPAGNLRRQPSLKAPLYYAAVSGGYYDFGAIKAGEKAIPRNVVDKTMLKILAKQGYLPANEAHPADVILIWKWGTMNVQYFLTPGGMHTMRLNERQIQGFLGGGKLGLLSRHTDHFPEYTLSPGLFPLTGDARDLMEMATDDLYVVAVAAYDAKLRDETHAELLWNTRISAPARGFWMPEALPAMLAIAAPNVGRETPKPVWMRATEKFKPDIQLGDTKLVEYLESAEATVATVGSAN
jgi:hypothetical protein